ncbi:MAG TPA: Mur ligase family protein [Gemmatimonadales bacterium]|nr:Mur ligase family protein [Gemmatimonadales bacterium]
MEAIASPARTDSRRLTGPSRLLPRAGAVIEVTLPEAEADRIVAAWRRQARRLLDALGWDEEFGELRWPGGASLAFTAPPDALYSATEVNEWAWDAALATVAGGPEPSANDAAAALSERITRERNPALIALRDAATQHGVSFLSDSRNVSVGLGAGSMTWPLERIPAAAAVPWPEVHDVPTVLVTGSNGKTTTVRLLAALVAAGGRVPGQTSTDGVVVAGEGLAQGDYAGPEGARLLLRDRRVEVAILETARGGILRRGLAVERADVAVVTNVAEDHFGEFGVFDCAGLAEVKLVVTRVVPRSGRVVLNADDPWLVRGASQVTAPIVWFAFDSTNPTVRAHIGAGGDACLVEDGTFVLVRGGVRETVAPVAALPITFGGAARHNVANALAAIAAASALGVPTAAIARGLERFAGSPADNPGRANVFEVGGARVVVDFAHNPHGMTALGDIASALRRGRTLVALGQAGDRDDESIRELARAAFALRPDHVIVKEMDKYRRGRAPGEVPQLITAELRRLGLPADAISTAPDDMGALKRALDWARPGDLLLVTIHVDQREALALLANLASR